MNMGGILLLPGFLPGVHVDDVSLETHPLFPVKYYHKRRSAHVVYRDSVLLRRESAATRPCVLIRKKHSECCLKAGIYTWPSCSGNKNVGFKEKHTLIIKKTHTHYKNYKPTKYFIRKARFYRRPHNITTIKKIQQVYIKTLAVKEWLKIINWRF